MTPTFICIALAIHFEARGEPLAGQMAVAETIMTRAERRGLSPCEVVFQPGQFHGPLRHFHDGMPMPHFSRETLFAARHAFNDEPRLCPEADYFHRGQVPQWGRFICRIGAHTFYTTK